MDISRDIHININIYEYINTHIYIYILGYIGAGRIPISIF